METYFYADRSSSSAMHGRSPMPPIEFNLPELDAQSASPLEQVLEGNSEPDPLFFVESWTIGVNTAVQNLRQRRQRKHEFERRSHTNTRLQHLRTLSFVQERVIGTELLSSSRPASVGDTHVSGLLSQPCEAQSAMAHKRDSQNSDAICEEYDNIQRNSRPLTLQAAYRLLAVTSTSTRDQIKAAYRKMASRYHPDRLVSSTERERQLGTDRMATINEAYRLLST